MKARSSVTAPARSRCSIRVESERTCHEYRSRRLHDQDPEQRQSRRRPAGAARAGELASRLYRLVDGHGAGRFPGRGGLSAHRHLGRPEGLGQVRLRQDAGIPLGHLAGAEGRRSQNPVWQDIPGEYRAMLRRLVVIQGDTEPASVEQQRHLGKTAPSLYDMRNVFQVNVEEGRHLWAMVYILQKYFGRDGREEAAELLQRRSGDADKPRMLGAFNEATPDWLSFHMFTFFTDRDGKMQLESLAQSGFDPLSRTCRFMLTEEAHHMFVGETGVGRTIQRTC